MWLPVPLERLAVDESLLANTPSPGPASLPVPNPTRSFWLDSSDDANPLADHGSSGPLSESADVCIIGSGISGVSAALHLSILSKRYAQPLRVVVLEARQFCSGATGRNGGHLVPNPFYHFQHYVARFGIEDAKKAIALEKYDTQFLLDLIDAEGWADDIDLVRSGRTILLFTQPEKQTYESDCKLAKENGVDLGDIEWLNADETKKRFGARFPAVLGPGNTLWPLKLVTRIFLHAQLSVSDVSPPFHLELHTHTPVLSVGRSAEQNQSERWTLETPRGQIRCRYVIHTTNAYASHLLPHMQGPRGIIPVRGQVMATRSAVPARELVNSSWTANEGFEYWCARPVAKPDDIPLAILGGGREASDEHELYETDDSRINRKISTALRQFLPTVFPGKYKETRVPEMEWTGIMGYTTAGDPFVGPVVDHDDPESRAKFEGQYISAGFTGHGMPRATACAEVVTQMIFADAFPSKFGKWAEPVWLPKHYLTTFNREDQGKH